jgi:hypothetical protein
VAFLDPGWQSGGLGLFRLIFQMAEKSIRAVSIAIAFDNLAHCTVRMEHFSGQNKAIIAPRSNHFASITASR